MSRVLRLGGLYRLDIANPFASGTWENDWREDGYAVGKLYADRSEIVDLDPHWVVFAEDGTQQRVLGPREFQHALGPVLTTLADLGFVLKGLWERPDNGDPAAEPGTWEHFISVLPLWLLLELEK